jgi:hypothetical protein
MACECGSERIASFQAKCSDMSSTSIDHLDARTMGYVPSGLGIGAGDYVRLDFCLDCGRIQDWTPVSDIDLCQMDEFAIDDGEEE